MKLWVDDERQAPKGWVRADNYVDALSILSGAYSSNVSCVNEISLDHDLGEAKTGYDICKYMVENEIFPMTINIHTANPVGRDNMRQLLERYAPYGTVIDGRVKE